MARNLAEADLDWNDAGPPAEVAAEMHRVEEVLRAENGQWGQLVVESATPAAPTEREGPPPEG